MFVEGTIKKISILFILGIFSLFLGYLVISLVIFLLIIFIMLFFRDPERETPSGRGLIVAPADGRIFTGKIDEIRIVKHDDPLMSYMLEKGEKGILISTFMSPFDVHVNRIPISGEVIKSKYFPGKFKIAWKTPQNENEKNLIVIKSKYGNVGVIQVAGFIARRIIRYVNVGDKVNIGNRLGMIRFGSRVDLIIPFEKSALLVKAGEKSKAGETIIAQIFNK
jgi:phosphatidylserine decarboxylase